jgi:regulator of protease activity HflC (stomatin/prohibitin superfamily)
MSVEAEQLDDWIGSEVLDTNGEKLGKVTEVYYKGTDALVVEFRSGLIGLDAEGLELVARTDGRVEGLPLEQLESGTDRKERLEAAREAAARADALEADAARRAEEAEIAAKQARDSAKHANEAEQAKQEAQKQAQEARKHADELKAD